MVTSVAELDGYCIKDTAIYQFTHILCAFRRHMGCAQQGVVGFADSERFNGPLVVGNALGVSAIGSVFGETFLREMFLRGTLRALKINKWSAMFCLSPPESGCEQHEYRKISRRPSSMARTKIHFARVGMSP